MVFHSDPLWQEDFRKVGKRYDEGNKYEFVRFRSWDTEHLLIQCVKRFMPFVRTIYIILARESQKQEWMDEEGVRIVYHKDFIPERFLPTFNSRTIEMFLHLIPDISDLFLYGNDDMFPLSPMNRKDFFVRGVPCLHYTEKPFPEEPNNFHLSALNGLNFIAGMFDMRYEKTWLKGGHSITPMVKGTWEFLWENYADVIENSITAFREPHNFNQWLCPWWHYFAGEYCDRSPKRQYVSVRKPVEDIVAVIEGDEPGIVCINDNECEQDFQRYGNAVKSAISKLLENHERKVRTTVPEGRWRYCKLLYAMGHRLLQRAISCWR